MEVGASALLDWLALAEHELLLFAGCFFLLGALDEFGIDVVWGWLKLTGRARTGRIDRAAEAARPLKGRAAVFIPAWREADVIGATVTHALSVWPQRDLTLYVGCYRNDPATMEAVMQAARSDARVRLVIHDRDGPTTKADCLNRLYRAMCDDERRRGEECRMVLLHDAEDMVDPAALAVLDNELDRADFIQLPVRPEPQGGSRWVAGHYLDEFAEAHAKAMVVRDALSAGLPAAGVGCAFARPILGRLTAVRSGSEGPFAVDSLTEDYELGIRIKALGGKSRFLRLRGDDGELVATRACFPAQLNAAIRQKTRWVHGIAFQGWDRLGWHPHPVELWMRMRDRRGPLTALVLAIAYLLLVIAAVLWAAEELGFGRYPVTDGLLVSLVAINFASFVWRAAMRFAFTTREYGMGEGIRAIARIPVANVIAIMAGRRALFSYLASLAGVVPRWDKTHHDSHPAIKRGAAA
ncbi:MAG: hypothetical protein BGO57_06765 [Sphingomonadales bacterium 63-6]|nr:MAG: hypothetical protein BGO57_06765 [Sphingomonadales bacterium 63-6]